MQADALRRRFPPRPDLDAWPQTLLARAGVDGLLAAAPFTVAGQAGEQNRHRGIGIVLDWLQAQPGDTWQQRWQASGAGQDGRADWRAFPVRWRVAAGSPATAWDGRVVTAGLLSLICADVIRPGIGWMLTTATPKRLAAEMARTRDPAGLTGPAAPTVRALAADRRLSVDRPAIGSHGARSRSRSAWPARLTHCPTAVSRSFPAAVNAQSAIAIRQASG